MAARATGRPRCSSTPVRSCPGAELSDGTEIDVTIIDAFEAVGACARGLMSREGVDTIGERSARVKAPAADVHRQHDGQCR